MGTYESPIHTFDPFHPFQKYDVLNPFLFRDPVKESVFSVTDPIFFE